MAPCAATLTICERPNVVIAPRTEAAPAISTIGMSRSVRRLPITSSTTYLTLAGSTSPSRRANTMRTSPIASERRCSHTSARASARTLSTLYLLRFSAIAEKLQPALLRQQRAMHGASRDRAVRCGRDRQLGSGRDVAHCKDVLHRRAARSVHDNQSIVIPVTAELSAQVISREVL